jgi:hypothetical protein
LFGPVVEPTAVTVVSLRAASPSANSTDLLSLLRGNCLLKVLLGGEKRLLTAQGQSEMMSSRREQLVLGSVGCGITL